MAANCTTVVPSRRRLFWATQPDACGSSDVCGVDCGVPGLSFVTDENCTPPNCPPPITQEGCPPALGTTRTFITTDWLRGLIINMLMTDGRQPDTECGYRPGSQGGHWSESYIENGPTTIGTLMRTVPATGRLQDGINLIVAYAKATLQRLVERGVAISVDVTGTYKGGNRMQLDIIVTGRSDGTARVGISGQRMENGWIWNGV